MRTALACGFGGSDRERAPMLKVKRTIPATRKIHWTKDQKTRSRDHGRFSFMGVASMMLESGAVVDLRGRLSGLSEPSGLPELLLL